ncbi:MAG: SiaB family protein kinase [Bacteroidales bacterium]|nr:SiaB family protein kinase [Bacteroidales bacterium]
MKNVLSYHGPVNIDLVSFMANYMKEVVNAEQAVTKRLFKVFIELAQNVSLYSAHSKKGWKPSEEMNRGIGWLQVDENEGDFTVASGNLIRKEHGNILQRNCDEINMLEEDELRELKRKTRNQADVRDVGAHIGLIHTGLISGNPLNVEISPIDDNHSFFRISVKIDKIINN